MSWPTFWKKKQWQSTLLLPLSKLVCWEAARRLKRFEAEPPLKQTNATVIVVGNIVVGGTGKTPFIIWLANQLQKQNLAVGIISRGYGAKNKHWPYWVTNQSLATECGDEPLMLAKQTGCPVAVSPKRVEALALLNQKAKCDVIISDDGLQHYALQRDIEIVLIDAQRQFGNACCIPSGPLREPLSRIEKVDFTVWNGLSVNQPIPQLAFNQKKAVSMQLKAHAFRLVGNPAVALSVADFLEKYPSQSVKAIAGIGNPQRFFNTLQEIGLQVDGTEFKDHYAYQKSDFQRLLSQSSVAIDQKPLIMTEKDAVKCTDFAKTEMHWWYLEVLPECDVAIVDSIVNTIVESVSQ
ncbi:tetraacyldisaccharide 4'-kinase [Thiomicrorhabdus sp.]|uniref:tetraacyldisaccharide 4'-kinase n=1 Tax=Thiomicrorhabdus sp. TaxID=2039724 RepID=UPI002AA92914|nr:tetraacyldisaccharide 4'-kinase [Thiomicrorhabdus sp.]